MKTKSRLRYFKLPLFFLVGLFLFANTAQGQDNIHLGAESNETSNYFPLNYTFNYTYTQTIYSFEELQEQGAIQATEISKIYFKPENSSSTERWKDWVVYMANTDKEGFADVSDWMSEGEMDVVFNGQITDTVIGGEWLEITLDDSFSWDGESNIILAIDQNTQNWGGDNPHWAAYTSNSNNEDLSKGIYFYSDSENPDPADPIDALDVTNTVAQIQLFGDLMADCEGTPNAGTTGDDMSVCAGFAFMLSVEGASIPANGLEGIWQSSEDGEEWTDIEDAISTTYWIEDGIEEETYYRYTMECGNSGESDVSNTLLVSLNPESECYCQPEYAAYCEGSASDHNITNVTLEGENNTLNNDSGCSENSYGDYTEGMPVPDLKPGENYTVSISTNWPVPTMEHVRVWVDFDNSGSFEDEEEIAVSGNNGLLGGTQSINFTIPETGIDSGEYRMRVSLLYEGQNNIEPCGDPEGKGETEDYTIEILELEQCEGMPSAGTPEVSALDVCANVAFVLSVDGASEPAAGLARVWQSSPHGEDDWTDMDGVTSSHVTIEQGVTESTDYRYKVVCNETDTDISEVIEVLIDVEGDCYCIPPYAEFSNIYYNETITTNGAILDLDYYAEQPTDGGYTNNSPRDTLIVYPGQEIEVSIDGSLPGFMYSKVWVDWDSNRSFEDDGDLVLSTSELSPVPFEESFIVPEDAVPGTISRIRFRTNRTENPNPCDGFGLGMGSTEDFTIKIVEEPTCFYPTEVEVEYITETSAWVTWTPSNEEDEWLVIYGYSGLNPDLQEGDAIQVTGDSAVELTGLAPDTPYDVFVKAVCDAETESYYTQATSFRTNVVPPENTYLCDAIELGLNAGCGGGPYTNVDAFQEYNEPVGSCLNVFEGVNTVWFTFEAPSNGEVLITTDFEQTGFITEIVAFEAPQDCEDMSTMGEEVGCASNGSELELDNLTPGETYYVRIGGFDNAVGNFCVEIQTEGTATCPAPSDITVEVEGQSVAVSWTPGGEEDQWTVIYGETGFNPEDEGEMVIVNDAPETTLTDLEPETDYDVYVMAMCEDDDTSVMVGPESFNSGDMSVEDYLFEDFSYYPNPVNDQLTLKAGTQIESVTVFNLLGQTVITENPNQLEIQLNTENLQAGVYLMKVNLNGNVKTFRVVKK